MISKFLDSSLISSISYDKFQLLINFKNGTSYIYYNVPYNVYEDLANAKSAGKFYNQKIKGYFQSKKVI